MPERSEYQPLPKAVAWRMAEDMTTHGEFFDLSCIGSHSLYRAGWSFFVNCVVRRSGMLHKLLVTTLKNSPYRYLS